MLLPKTTNAALNKIRDTAALHLILMGDADDQSTLTVSMLNTFFANYDNAGSSAVVHGIVCPVGQSCNGEPGSVRNVQVIAASGGITGDFQLAQNNSRSSRPPSTRSSRRQSGVLLTAHVRDRPVADLTG